MVKRILLILLVIIILGGIMIGWRFFMSNTSFSQKTKFLYIRTGQATKTAVLNSLVNDTLVDNPGSFEFIANRMDVWEKLRPGKYEVRKGTSLFELARILRNGTQSPVNLVITKLRTKEDLASLIGKKFECDSASVISYMNNPDTLNTYGLDSNTIMTTVFPNTYTYFWNSTPAVIFKKLFAEREKFWTEERKRAAAERGLNPVTAYTLASIVEEETNDNEEKGMMASVYRNRITKGIRLGADPTVKFALRDFGLKRIYEKHTAVISPYNTYRVSGLPPGPICTPSIRTLEETINSPNTNYLYFVAKSDLSGKHQFTETYDEHMKYAKQFHKTLDSLFSKKKPANEDTGH
jgi:UPF0755 protein